MSVNKTNPNWNGSPLTLAQYDTASMPQTTYGSMVLAYQNTGTQNSAGTLVVTSGGNAPLNLPAPALTNQPNVYVGNWAANNLNLSNTSANAATPIWTE